MHADMSCDGYKMTDRTSDTSHNNTVALIASHKNTVAFITRIMSLLHVTASVFITSAFSCFSCVFLVVCCVVLVL